MLYHLLVPLADAYSVLNVFRYITFRTAAATLTALFLSLVAGPAVIRHLAALRVGQPIREIGPAHQGKAGTPTMGGLLILLSLIVSVLLWSNLDSRFVWILLGLTVGYGLLGFLDDYRKVRQRKSDGISAKAKLFWQTSLAVVVAFAIYTDPSFDAELAVPFFKNFTPHMGWLYIPMAALIIVGASNAVNLTDGLDGLAIGPVIMAGAAFGVIAYLTGNFRAADYLKILNVRGAGELTVFCGALIGAAIGFLWFNCHPP